MKTLYRFLREIGIDVRKILSFFRNTRWYLSDYLKIRRELKNVEGWDISSLYPCLHDRSDSAGFVSGHYFNQDLLAAQKIFKRKPEKHVDIGSSINGFVAHVASYREVEIFDIRPLKTYFENIIFKEADLMKLDKKYENYTDSLSSLHALEHFGLGRYGDSLDVYGHKRGFENMAKMLKKRGYFYFSVPIGKQRIEFNAHRVFSVKEILNLANKNNLKIISFSYVNDKGKLYKNVELNEKNIGDMLKLNFGCGIFEFRKE